MSNDPSDPRHANRAHPRFEAKFHVSVAYKGWDQVMRLITLNASRGGVFVRGEKPPEVGTTLLLTMELPNGSKVDLKGSVAHVITPELAAKKGIPPGFGVRLDSSPDLVLLESMASSFDSNLSPESFADAPSGLWSIPQGAAKQSGIKPPPIPEAAAPKRSEQLLTSIQIKSNAAPIAVGRLATALQKKGEVELEDAPCQSEIVVGIDYGTSYSTIAAVRDGKAFIVRDTGGRWLVPSVVSYPETGGVMVGWDARERIATDPAHTVQSAKRLLGRKMADPLVANYVAQLPYKCISAHADQVALELGGPAPLSIPQMVAEVLRLLKRRAEQTLGVAVEDAVIVCPVTYEVAHRNALRKAAQLAGLRVVGLVDEPAAAALAYGFGGGRNEMVAVYDFGGGTFDFTLIDISNEVFRMIRSAGDPWLGGDDFDLALAKEVANSFWKQHKIELQKRLVEWQRLLFACESAKRDLTDGETAEVEVLGIARTSRGPIDLQSSFTRARFEELCSELVSRTIDVMGQALTHEGLEPKDIGQVVLTSGVTRIPMVRRAVSQFFERQLDQIVHPEEAVALGAAIQGASLAAQTNVRLHKR